MSRELYRTFFNGTGAGWIARLRPAQGAGVQQHPGQSGSQIPSAMPRPARTIDTPIVYPRVTKRRA